MITTLKFSDGSEMSFNECQMVDLREYFQVTSKKNKDMDFYKEKVLSYIKKGLRTKAVIINRLRGHDVAVCKAIDELLREGVLIKKEHVHKYCKSNIVEFFIV